MGKGEGLTTKRDRLATGGSEEHKLTIEELPPHKFTTNGKVAGTGGDRYNAGGKDYPVVGVSNTTIETETLGKGNAISLMPPYLALLACKKD